MHQNKPFHTSDCRLIAFYLPQFHPIPENNAWWGNGFTEWTNVAKAKPLFRGHVQPKLPADLGFYDLRVPEVREQQAKMAKQAGIEGFCYWHYWFGHGKMLLEKPFREVLDTGKPDYPFCLAWANESWSGIWHGAKENILQQQLYPGTEDYKQHFNYLLPAFVDKRYITIDDKPLFIIYRPHLIPDIKSFIDLFQNEAQKNNLKGIYFAGYTGDDTLKPADYHLDAIIFSGFENLIRSKAKLTNSQLYTQLKNHFKSLFIKKPDKVYSYRKSIQHFLDYDNFNHVFFPVVFPNWDNSPRCGRDSLIITGSTPALFKKHLQEAIDKVEDREFDKKIIFIKSWNEWAEGNYLEPDSKYGWQYLEAVKEALRSLIL